MVGVPPGRLVRFPPLPCNPVLAGRQRSRARTGLRIREADKAVPVECTNVLYPGFSPRRIANHARNLTGNGQGQRQRKAPVSEHSAELRPVQWYVRLLAPEPAPPRQPARHEEDARSGEHDRICKERQQRHRLTGRQYDRQDHGDAKESYPERHSLASRLPGILQPKVQRAPELQPDQPHLETLVTRSAISGRPCALLTGCGRRL